MKNKCTDCQNCSPIVPKKVYCVPECPDCTPCEQLYLSNCIIFENDDDSNNTENDGLLCFGVESGASITDLLLNLLEKLFPECHPTTSTSTSTSTTSTSTTSTTTVLSSTTTTINSCFVIDPSIFNL